MSDLILLGTAFFWYVLALTSAAPGITGGDSPELAAAAFHLGSAHAPGYPIFITAGHLFELLPFGTPAFRMTVFSILAQCAAFIILVSTLRDLGRSSLSAGENNRLALLTGGLVMAGPLVFHQMVSPEVFALHFLFTAILLRSVLFPTTSHFYEAGFWAGAALSHQHLALLILPALGWTYRKELQDIKKISWAMSFFILGLSPYLILSLRAVRSPLVNWGDPSTLNQLVYHMTRTQYGGDVTNGSWLNGFWDLYLYSKDWLLESCGLGLALSLLGFFKNRKKLGPEYFIGAFCLFVLLPFLIRGDYDPESNHINEAFLPPAFLWFSPLMLRGLEWIHDKKRHLRPLILSALVIAVAVLAFFSRAKNDATRNLAAEDIGSDILQQMPLHSVLFSSGDSITFPLAYLKLVKNFRPDLNIFDRTGGLFPDIYHLLDYRNRSLSAPPPPLAAAEESFQAHHHPSAVFYSEKEDAPSENLAMIGLLFQKTFQGEPAPIAGSLWKIFRAPRIAPNHDYFSRETAARYYLFQAAYDLYITKDEFKGEECLTQGKNLAFDNSRLLLNAGVLENTHGWTDWAALSFEKASQLTPNFFLPWFDRGIVAENRGLHKDALKFFRKAVKLNPSYAYAHQHLGFQYYQAGLFDQAVQEWETVRKLDPTYAEAYRTLGYMFMSTRPDYAAQMLEHYLLLAPNAPDKATISSWMSSQPHR